MNPSLMLKRLFDWKVRGIRWVEIIGVVMVAAMIFSVYIAKAAAARESSRIDELNRDIAENRQRVRLLRAEISRLEQPSRLEALSREAGLAPVDVRRQATENELPDLKPTHAPAPVQAPVAAPAAAAPAPATTTGEPQ
ncbi:cell division protein FtsL [Brevundimonas goettingensis]|uniref:Cell division protein n=1 Tax=Brevundimonas goettingensis TaxID=2774190 RepID=A0A975BYN7_9CAUL|nr:cell division protein [Brevundimonas goettingensis]QTC90058.1 cell division protein [Brevundimonas goettingensis]